MEEIRKKNGPIRLSSSDVIEGNRFICNAVFANNEIIPIFESLTTHGFNQLLGKVKFINREYGTVYYRGENKLHQSLIPSLYRGNTKVQAATSRLCEKIKSVMNDPKLSKELKLSTNGEDKAEAIMQHYGCRTRFVDIVDNHWVSLWMGLHRLEARKVRNTYYTYVPRVCYGLDYFSNYCTKDVLSHENESYPKSGGLGNDCTRQAYKLSEHLWKRINSISITGDNYLENDLYMFVLLVAAPVRESSHKKRNEEGIIENDEVILADLRRCLPSTFLRPHAQHALVIKKKGGQPNKRESFDLSTNVVGIICIRIDRAADWLGAGKFLTQDNLFPPPMFDHGYDVLLSRCDIFDRDEFRISRYV